MAELTTTVHDVLNPLTGERVSLRWGSGGAVTEAGFAKGEGRDVDGAGLWVLPALYDADAHMPLVQWGLRHFDRQGALSGGVALTNVAIPWQLVRGLDVKAFAAELARFTMPRIVPLLSISPDADSLEFPGWMKAWAGEFRDYFPGLCKVYSTDPNLERNIEAIWDAGLKPMIWNWNDGDLEKVLKLAGDRPIHLRHATSSAMVGVMRQAAGATIQTSPHFLLPLAPGKAPSLNVLPPLPPVEVSRTLAEVFLGEVNMIASDHNAPPVSGPAGPGLYCQQHYLSVLLTIAETYGWALGDVLAKTTEAPAGIFGQKAPAEMLLVDPAHIEEVKLWPGQSPERAPFEGLALKGKVLAVLGAGEVALV